MANKEHLSILKKGVAAWNTWRRDNPKIRPDLSYARLRGVDMTADDIGRANFFEVDFSRATLQEANFEHAILRRAIMRYANLERANLQRVDLRRADLRDSNLCNATISGDLASCRLDRANLSSARLRADLEAANLDGADLRDADLCSKDLESLRERVTRFSATKLRDANIAGIRGLEAVKHTHPSRIDAETILTGSIPEAFLRCCKIEHEILTLPDPSQHVVEVVKLISDELIKYLQKHPNEMYNIRPRQFEELIAEILSSFGWAVELTPETRDGGYDLFAICKDISGVTSKWIIECKKYAATRKVGVDVVRSLYGVKRVQRGANALLATTSFFSNDAINYKAERYDLALRDFIGVMEWINQYKAVQGKQILTLDKTIIWEKQRGPVSFGSNIPLSVKRKVLPQAGYHCLRSQTFPATQPVNNPDVLNWDEINFEVIESVRWVLSDANSC